MKVDCIARLLRLLLLLCANAANATNATNASSTGPGFDEEWIVSQGLVVYDSRCLQDSRNQAFNCRLGKLEEKRFKIQNIGCGVGGESVRFLELFVRFRSPKCSAFISTMVVDLNAHHLPT